MKRATIQLSHLEEEARKMNFLGIPIHKLYNEYWVKVGNREYPFDYLTEQASLQMDSNRDNWSEFTMQEYCSYLVKLGAEVSKPIGYLAFFEREEFEVFEQVAGQKYRTADSENVRFGDLIKTTAHKLNSWAKQSLIQNFEFQLDRHWQWSGTFKSYLWVRIFREGDSRMVYFVVGLNWNGDLYMQLNCQRSNHTSGSTIPLAEEKIQRFDDFLSQTTYEEVTISKEEIQTYNWESLIEKTQSYLHQYSDLYDELERLVMDENWTPDDISSDNLDFSDPPTELHSYVNRERSYGGREIDWDKKQVAQKNLGDEGERIVILAEQKKLKEAGLDHRVDQVKKMLDGEGYDIKSFDEQDNEIHIEVKTTTRGINEPFYMSVNEKCYYEEHSENYFIYRLYNHNHQQKTAQCYILTPEILKRTTFSATNYEVSMKNEKK